MTLLLMFVAGLVALVIGANLLVRGASKLALSFGLSPLVVGLTIVAFGTSAPEVAVSVGAALEGRSELAVGNVVGSNIFNVLFILGASALIVPLTVHMQLIRQEVPIMIGASVLLLVTALDGRISFLEAAMMFGLLLAYTGFLVVQSRRQTASASAEFDDEVKPAGANDWDRHWSVQALLVVAGLVGLVLGAGWLVDASVTFARQLGVSETVIGLTIVAAGTSLPEVATSITAAIKGERDIAVGNVVGSNTFNILGCLGLSGMVSLGGGGLPIAESVLQIDLWVMVGVALLCLPLFLTGREIARWEGGLMLGFYIAYVAFLVLTAQQSPLLGSYSQVLMSVVMPLAVVAIVVSLLRRKPGS